MAEFHRLSRRQFVGGVLTAASMLTVANPVLAQVVGKDYVPINPPQPTDVPGKIEVLEFFHYACPHCNHFYPMLTPWAAKLPGDVVLRKIPATFGGNPALVNLAKLYYTLEALGKLPELDGEVFKAFHVENLRNLPDERVMQEWAVKKGIDGKKFSETLNSFGVVSKVKRGEQVARNYRNEGVPSLIVDGRYQVASMENQAEMLVVADKLIAKARAENASKAGGKK